MKEIRITPEQFASELSGMHNWDCRVEHGDIVIDDGWGVEYVIRAVLGGGRLRGGRHSHKACCFAQLEVYQRFE